MKINVARSSLLAAIARVRPFVVRKSGVRPVRLINDNGLVRLETGSIFGNHSADPRWVAYAGVQLVGGGESWDPVSFDLDALEAAVGLGTDAKVALSHDGTRGEVDGFPVVTCRVAWSIPKQDRMDEKVRVFAQPEELGASLKAVIPFAAKEITRYAINGVRIEVGEHGLHVTATDGRRLASTTLDAVVVDGFTGFTLPLGVAKPIASRAVIALTSQVSLAWNNRTLEGRLGGENAESLWGFTVESNGSPFPDWRNILPKNNGNVAKVSTSELGGAMKGLKPLLPKGKDAFRAVRLAGVGAALSLAVLRGKDGSEEHPVPFNVPTQSIVGGFDVTLNPDYVADVVKATKARDLRVSVKDDCSPVLFQPVDDDRFVAVVMPITSA
jgi:DNA polymerase III sliding clamp (beta) subunit (PCNA family)